MAQSTIMDYEELLQIEENSFTVDELLKAYYAFFQLPMAVIDQNYNIKGHFFLDSADDTYMSNIQRGSWSMELTYLLKTGKDIEF